MATDPSDVEDAAGCEEALKKYRMIDARLRRLCEVKASGKCKVPQSIHDAWKKGGTSRDELRVWLEKLDLDKDPYDQLCSLNIHENKMGPCRGL